MPATKKAKNHTPARCCSPVNVACLSLGEMKYLPVEKNIKWGEKEPK